jgi:hypothetical protein
MATYLDAISRVRTAESDLRAAKEAARVALHAAVEEATTLPDGRALTYGHSSLYCPNAGHCEEVARHTVWGSGLIITHLPNGEWSVVTHDGHGPDGTCPRVTRGTLTEALRVLVSRPSSRLAWPPERPKEGSPTPAPTTRYEDAMRSAEALETQLNSAHEDALSLFQEEVARVTKDLLLGGHALELRRATSRSIELHTKTFAGGSGGPSIHGSDVFIDISYNRAAPEPWRGNVWVNHRRKGTYFGEGLDHLIVVMLEDPESTYLTAADPYVRSAPRAPAPTDTP